LEDDHEDERKTPVGVWIFHATWATAVLIAIAGHLLKDNPNKYGYLQTVVLTLTLIALVVYTHFTRKMQQAIVKQTNVNILPAFVVHIGDKTKDGEGGHKFDLMELENIGNGVALNVRIETIDIGWSDPAIENVWPKPQIVFNGVMSIKPSERITLIHRSIIGPVGESPGGRFDWMDKLARRADYDYELRIRFADVLSNRYIQTIHVGISGDWPDAVVEEYKDVNSRTPLTPVRENPFLHSPLKYLRRRR
jgi:hypothetical protein